MPKVAINLVTWNGEKTIEYCLNSVLAQTFQDFLLLIIDNNSADTTAKIIEENYLPALKDKIKLVRNKSNLGFAFAHNQAILWTDSDYVLTLNQDVILQPDFLSAAVKFLDQHREVGSVSAKVLRWENKEEADLKKSQKLDIIDSLGLKIFKSQRIIDKGAGQQDLAKDENITEIFGPSAACPVYRRAALEDARFEAEFFDNDFFLYKEDVDLAYRLVWRGWKSYYLPKAIAWHERTARGQETDSLMTLIRGRRRKTKLLNKLSYRNHLFVLYKNLSRRNFWRYFFYIFFYEFKKLVFVTFLEPSSLKGLTEFFSKRKRMKIKRQFIMSRRLVKDEEVRKWFN